MKIVKQGKIQFMQPAWANPEKLAAGFTTRNGGSSRPPFNSLNLGFGSGDLQYATDCHVRFTHLGELCNQPWGHGYEHIRRVLTDHATFPRAVCRHGGPDTDPYDISVTMASGFVDFTHNRSFWRAWVPWKKFPCQVPEEVTQYPARP